MRCSVTGRATRSSSQVGSSSAPVVSHVTRPSSRGWGDLSPHGRGTYPAGDRRRRSAIPASLKGLGTRDRARRRSASRRRALSPSRTTNTTRRCGSCASAVTAPYARLMSCPWITRTTSSPATCAASSGSCGGPWATMATWCSWLYRQGRRQGITYRVWGGGTHPGGRARGQRLLDACGDTCRRLDVARLTTTLRGPRSGGSAVTRRPARGGGSSITGGNGRPGWMRGVTRRSPSIPSLLPPL